MAAGDEPGGGAGSGVRARHRVHLRPLFGALYPPLPPGDLCSKPDTRHTAGARLWDDAADVSGGAGERLALVRRRLFAACGFPRRIVLCLSAAGDAGCLRRDLAQIRRNRSDRLPRQKSGLRLCDRAARLAAAHQRFVPAADPRRSRSVPSCTGWTAIGALPRGSSWLRH